MRKKDGSEAYQRGLTLIELMVAMAICFIVIGAVYRAFTSQQRTYAIQDQVAEAQQNARAVRKGANEEDPDAIIVVGCFGSPKGYLTRTADRDDTQIAVKSTGNELNQIFRSDRSNYIFIGGMEKLRVSAAPGAAEGILTLNGPLTKRYPTGVLSASVLTGATQIPLKNTDGLRAGDILFLGQDRLIVRDVGTDTITIDTDPDLAANQGISGSYPAGTYVNPVSVYRLTAVEYSVETDAVLNRPNLIRDDVVEGKRTLAENIQGLEAKQEDQHLYRITVTAKTRVKDPDYLENDGYRTRILESQVTLRNL